MANADPTGFLLALAGNYTAANDWIESGFPNRALDTILAGSLSAGRSSLSYSSTSLTMGTGQKTLTLLDYPRGYPQSYPILLVSATSPFDHWMWGITTAPETALGEITVEVVLTGPGLGSKADWSLVTLWLNNTISSVPVPLSDGGFAVSMANTSGASIGRKNVEVPRMRPVRGVDEIDPSSVDGAYSPGDFGHIASSGTIGAFIGNENKLFRFDSVGSYTFYSLSENNPGDMIVIDDYGVSGQSLIRRFDSDSSSWIKHSSQIETVEIDSSIVELSLQVRENLNVNYVITGSSNLTIHLPDVSAWQGYAPMLSFRRAGTGTVRIDVAGGGYIDGDTQVFLFLQYSSVLITVDSISSRYSMISRSPIGSIGPTWGFGIGSGTQVINTPLFAGSLIEIDCSTQSNTFILDTIGNSENSVITIARRDSVGANTCTVSSPDGQIIGNGLTGSSYLIPPLTIARFLCGGIDTWWVYS